MMGGYLTYVETIDPQPVVVPVADLLFPEKAANFGSNSFLSNHWVNYSKAAHLLY